MPVMPNPDSSLPSQIDIASHGVLAMAHQIPHSDRTKLDTGIPLVLDSGIMRCVNFRSQIERHQYQPKRAKPK